LFCFVLFLFYSFFLVCGRQSSNSILPGIYHLKKKTKKKKKTMKVSIKFISNNLVRFLFKALNIIYYYF
jgi:hypothetical protein